MKKIKVGVECQDCKNYNTIEVDPEKDARYHIICYNCDSNINIDIGDYF